MRPALSALLVLALVPCAGAQICPADDAFEPNDACGAATVLAPGALTDLALHGPASALGPDLDHYAIDVGAGQQLTVDVLFSMAGGDIDVALYEGPGCATLVDTGSSTTDDETVTATNTTGSTLTYTLAVEPWGGGFGCNDYDLNIALSGDPCASQTPDSFEQNDGCAAAQALSSGFTPDLNVQNGDEDYYLVTASAGHRLTIDVQFLHDPTADIDAELYADVACSTIVDASQSVNDGETVSFLNQGAADVDLVLRIYGFGTGFGCNDYDLVVVETPNPCAGLADDGLEENDDCAGAAAIVPGAYSGLAAFDGDEDWYAVSLQDGETFTADVFFEHADGDLDVVLWDCAGATPLAQSQTATDDEQLFWTNGTGASLDVALQVFVDPGSPFPCNEYELQLAVAGGSLGTPMCPGDGSVTACPCGNESDPGSNEGCLSSEGHGAVLSASGSTSVGADDIAFTVAQARPSQPSLLVQGATLVGVPLKDGVLCAGSPTQRVEVVFLDANGSGTTVGSVVTEGNLFAGQTRYYQQWYRDPMLTPCGHGSNFSGGLSVVYGP